MLIQGLDDNRIALALNAKVPRKPETPRHHHKVNHVLDNDVYTRTLVWVKNPGEIVRVEDTLPVFITI